MISGPIVLVEDDADDVDIFNEVLKISIFRMKWFTSPTHLMPTIFWPVTRNSPISLYAM